MQEIIMTFMEEYGSLAVFLLILVENLFPPIPSEVILTFGGVMTTCTDMTVGEVILSSTCGSVLGAVILYLAGYLIPVPLLEKLVSGRIGKLLHFESQDIELARTWFANKGISAVFLCRLMPIVRSLISIPAGMSRIPWIPFLLLTFMGSLLWNTVLVFLGKAAGNSWEKVAEGMGVYSDLFLMGLGIGMLVLVVLWRRKGER